MYFNVSFCCSRLVFSRKVLATAWRLFKILLLLVKNWNNTLRCINDAYYHLPLWETNVFSKYYWSALLFIPYWWGMSFLNFWGIWMLLHKQICFIFKLFFKLMNSAWSKIHICNIKAFIPNLVLVSYYSTYGMEDHLLLLNYFLVHHMCCNTQTQWINKMQTEISQCPLLLRKLEQFIFLKTNTVNKTTY